MLLTDSFMAREQDIPGCHKAYSVKKIISTHDLLEKWNKEKKLCNIFVILFIATKGPSYK